MTDPHDRPYTFGWHGEIIRRPGHCAAPDPCGLGHPGCACGDEIRDEATSATETATRATRTPAPHPSSTAVIPGPQIGAQRHERETR